MTSNDEHDLQYPDFGRQYGMQGSNVPAPYRPDVFEATPEVNPAHWYPRVSRPYVHQAQACLRPTVDIQDFLQLRQQVVVLTNGLSDATQTIREMGLMMHELCGKLDDLSQPQPPLSGLDQVHSSQAETRDPGHAQKQRVPQIEVSLSSILTKTR
jgi:hypothetical protein